MDQIADSRAFTRRFGTDGPEVPVFGLGSWNTWNRAGIDEATAIVRRAVDAGVRLFDVAHYGGKYHARSAGSDLCWSEAIKAAGIAREEYVFSAKLMVSDHPGKSLSEQLTMLLERVELDRADIAAVGGYESEDELVSFVTEVGEQIRAGRLDAWGMVEWPFEHYRRACDFALAEGLTPPSFLQLKYGIARRTVGEGPEYGQECLDGRLALQASDVFDGGLLAGNKTPERPTGGTGEVHDAVKNIIDEVGDIASGFGATTAQLSLAFCLANPGVANVLFGVSKLSQLEEDLGALDLYANHGEELRAAVDHLWLDKGKIRSDNS